MHPTSLLLLCISLTLTSASSPSQFPNLNLSTLPFPSTKATNSNTTSSSNSTASTNTTCAPLHMIVARASTEPPGQGIIGAVATQVQSMVPGSDSEAVTYPATLTDYVPSEQSGVAAMRGLIVDYAGRCPGSKIALLGYSQGAQVIGDVMCGTSSKFFNATAPLDASVSKNIVAIVQMGDPTHVPGLSQDIGNSTKAGVFPRLNTAACGASTAVTQSYCNDDDKFCDSGNSIPVHVGYVKVFGVQAAGFIVGRVNGSVPLGTSGNGTMGR